MIMENYIHTIKVTLSILFIIVYSSCKKDPLGIVEEYSFLSMPRNAQVINFIDLENDRGEKVLFIDVKVTKENIEELTAGISDNKYKPLPIDDEIVTPEQNGAEIVKYLSKKMQDRFWFVNKYNQSYEGYYKIKKDDNNQIFKIVIIDKTDGRIIVYSLSQ